MEYKRKAMKLIYEKFDNAVKEREQIFKKIRDNYNNVVLCGINDLAKKDIIEVLTGHNIKKISTVDLIDELSSDIFYVCGDNIPDNIKNRMNEENCCFNGKWIFSKELDNFYALKVHDVAPNIGDLFGILGDEESGKAVYELVLVLLSCCEENVATKKSSEQDDCHNDHENRYKLGTDLWKIPLDLKKRSPLCKIYIRQNDKYYFSCTEK